MSSRESSTSPARVGGLRGGGEKGSPSPTRSRRSESKSRTPTPLKGLKSETKRASIPPSQNFTELKAALNKPVKQMDMGSPPAPPRRETRAAVSPLSQSRQKVRQVAPPTTSTDLSPLSSNGTMPLKANKLKEKQGVGSISSMVGETPVRMKAKSGKTDTSSAGERDDESTDTDTTEIYFKTSIRRSPKSRADKHLLNGNASSYSSSSSDGESVYDDDKSDRSQVKVKKRKSSKGSPKSPVAKRLRTSDMDKNVKVTPTRRAKTEGMARSASMKKIRKRRIISSVCNGKHAAGDSTTCTETELDTENESESRRRSKAGSTHSTDKPQDDKTFWEGQEVLVTWSDGLLYLGTLLKVDSKVEKCFVKFEDDSCYWALFRHIQRGPSQGEIHCCTCQGETSEQPNEIVLCDNCGLGYHQECHIPPIESDILKPDVPWLCRQCVFATSYKKGTYQRKGPLKPVKRVLPYAMSTLNWDTQHKTNSDQRYCYCGGPGDWYMKMLQCCRCRQWFHEACTQCLSYTLLYGDRFYIFVCTMCNGGIEYVKRLELKWMDVAQLALFNLTLQHNKKYYDFDENFMPWINQNWERLQVNHLDSTTRGERARTLLETLQGNKTRFAWGREIKKKVTLWGLRVRLPPPAPTVILPEDGQITDEVMNNLQMKGRKTKTFVPIESNSPIPLKHPKHPKRKCDSEDVEARTKLAKDMLMKAYAKGNMRRFISANTTYKGYNGNMSVYDFHDEDSDVDTNNNDDDESEYLETSSQSALDYFIPRPSSYEGYNHPFKTVVERNKEIEQIELKARILDWYQNGATESEQSQEEEDEGESVFSDLQTGQTVMASASYVATGRTNGLVATPPTSINGSPRKKRGRKSRAEKLRLEALAHLEAQAKEVPQSPNRGRCRNLSQPPVREQQTQLFTNAVDPAQINGVRKTEVNLNHLKNSVKNYFGAVDRLAKGERFTVLARRVTPDGRVQYLVEWEGMAP
ncbi:polycomb protein Pcl [Lingula anatina]|uniref:Polycomb protein Pcl n=1 Tax=Lingula anatina TaxID=7574 RepID=A0A1S3HRN6_LINAN|nr:polycomb protein Pcl [Lingula anatina]XP_013387715.1 polycomb protein Pcl [Lingula anatina]|eukprot:XP_013387714.1 polycomb protein Pcl [Lingula anatina]